MKTFLRIVLILLIIAVVAVGGCLYKYPFLSPTYRHKYPAAKYQAFIEEQPKPANAEQMIHAFNEMYPYWIGTRWNFNGISETPGDGSIACGYFVTTMMRDMDFDINRVKLAQCASEEMIKTLVEEKHIKRYNLVENELMFDNILKEGENLYIIGLDNHTGFLYCDGAEIWFIHSSGAFPYRVVKVDAASCITILKSRYKVVGCVSRSGVLL